MELLNAIRTFDRLSDLPRRKANTATTRPTRMATSKVSSATLNEIIRLLGIASLSVVLLAAVLCSDMDVSGQPLINNG